MTRALRLLASFAVLQMALPMPTQASTLMVPSCGGSGGVVPLHLPRKDDGSGNLPCCKVCHISMRKRSSDDSCCGEEDVPDGD